MTNITSSASKLVLLFLVLVLGILALIAGYHSVMTGDYNDASKAILASFGGAIIYVFGFYFNSKGDSNLPNAGK
jgi:steroid 5-alpha reductase family enzyme